MSANFGISMSASRDVEVRRNRKIL